MITTGAISISQALMVNRNIRELWLYHNEITVEGARLIIKSAVDNGVCEHVGTNFYNDEELMKMITILDDRKENV